MAISNRTRKLLWGRSGSRCAYCKCKLIMDATPTDDESVVGDECHIVTKNPNGPRYDPDLSETNLDSYDNLLLLCRVHHKMVDDQEATYTPEILRQLKADHERWVSERLEAAEASRKPQRTKLVPKNMPTYLVKLETGKELTNILSGAYVLLFSDDDLRSEDEVAIVSYFLQNAEDWIDLDPYWEPSNKVQAGFRLTQLLSELKDAGFVVFGGRVDLMLQEGDSTSEEWPGAILKVARNTNEEIIRFSLDQSHDR